MTRLKLNPPTVTFEVYLVPHGFQANLFLPGKDPLVIIRDFPDSYPVEQLVASLSERLEMMLSDFHRQPVPARRLHLEEGGELAGGDHLMRFPRRHWQRIAAQTLEDRMALNTLLPLCTHVPPPNLRLAQRRALPTIQAADFLRRYEKAHA